MLGSARPPEFPHYHPDQMDLYFGRQRPVGGAVYAGVLLVLVVSAAALPLVDVPVSVVASGVVRSALDSQSLVAPVGGQVVFVAPRGPRRVAAGDTVLLLENADLTARAGAVAARLEKLIVEERDLERLVSWAAEESDPPALESSRYRAELASALQELTAAKTRIRDAEREADRASALYQRELVSAAEAAALQDRVARERENSGLLQMRTVVRWRTEAAAVEESLRIGRAEEAGLQEQLDQLVVRAPVGGWLDRVTALSPGSRLLPGVQVATLTPAARLIAELYVDPREIDGIQPGARARLQLRSRQYSSDGSMEGVVLEVSPLLMPAGEGAVASVRVAPEMGALGDAPTDSPLRRGSTVVGRVRVGERTLWALLRGRRERTVGPVPTPAIAGLQRDD